MRPEIPDIVEKVRLIPIGVIHTPFTICAGTPIQPSQANGARGTVEVFQTFREALTDLEGFERIWLIYWFHWASKVSLQVKPFLDNELHGLFATRAPSRPNAIGISSVQLLRIDCGTLEVADVDILDGTPLLDIKPYVAEFDSYPGTRSGCLDKAQISRCAADGRFDLRSVGDSEGVVEPRHPDKAAQ